MMVQNINLPLVSSKNTDLNRYLWLWFVLDNIQCVWKRNAIHWIRALAAVLQFVSATLVVGFCGTSSLVTSSTDMPSSYSPVDPTLHDTVMYRYLTGKRVSKAIEGDDFVLISKRLWERKSRKFSSAGADTNPQNPRISDKLECKPLGFLITQLGQNILFFSYLIWSEVLRFLKCSLRYLPRRFIAHL